MEIILDQEHLRLLKVFVRVCSRAEDGHGYAQSIWLVSSSPAQEESQSSVALDGREESRARETHIHDTNVGHILAFVTCLGNDTCTCACTSAQACMQAQRKHRHMTDYAHAHTIPTCTCTCTCTSTQACASIAYAQTHHRLRTRIYTCTGLSYGKRGASTVSAPFDP